MNNLFACLSAVVALCLTGFSSTAAAEQLVYSDSFDGTSLSQLNSFWTPYGSNVVLGAPAGWVSIRENVTDTYTRIESKPFQGMRSLRVRMTHLMVPSTQIPNFYFPSLDFKLSNGQSISFRWLRSAYGPDYCNLTSGYDKVLIRDIDGCHLSSLTSSSMFNRTIVSEIRYDVVTGKLQYDLGADGTIDFETTLRAYPGAQIVGLAISGYGWFTGHRHDIDQIDVWGEATASNRIATKSYYISAQRSSTLAELGKATAALQSGGSNKQDVAVALLFGAPIRVGAEFGSAGFGVPATTSTITTLVKSYITGYYNALGSDKGSHLRVIVGTSNYKTAKNSQLTFSHGQAWALMVNDLMSWVNTQGYAGQVDVAGGIDAEMDWASPAETRTWIDGFGSVVPRRFVYNVGDAAGCPKTGTTSVSRSCNGGWTQDDVWYVSWGSQTSLALPEIYQTSSATQWAQVSLYGYLKYSSAMQIQGALSEFRACYPNPLNLKSSDPTCNPLFTPDYAFKDLAAKIDLDPRTAQVLLYSTDIGW